MTANLELELRWSGGNLDLMGWNDSDYGDFEIETLADGTDWGNPESVRRTLRSALLDGSVSVKERDDNRTIPLKLRVSAADGTSLAGGEAALALMDGRRCELAWTPPDEFAPTAVFVVVAATLRHEMNDLEELSKRRYYTLTLECLPHAFSDAYVTIPAVAQDVSTPTLIDDCTSLTGWAATNATLSLSDGAIVVTPPEGPNPADPSSGQGIPITVTATRTGAIDLTLEPYIAATRTGADYTLEALAGGAWVSLEASGLDGSDKVFDATELADLTIDALRFTWRDVYGWAQTIENVEKQATLRSSPSRYQIRTLSAAGSARTTASLLLASATTGLGSVVAYSGPAYDPDLSRGATAVRVADGDELSGGHTVVTSGVDAYEIPATDLFEGDHSLWVRAKPTGALAAGTATLTAKILTATDVEISSRVVGSAHISSTDYVLALVGSEVLPSAALPGGTTAKIRFEITWAYDGAPEDPNSLHVDTLLAFNRTLGALTIAEAGAYKKVWLDPATLTTDHPAVYVGDGDKADAIPLSLVSQLPSWPGAHVIEAPTTYLYTGTTGAPDTEVSGTFRPAWHTHPAS